MDLLYMNYYIKFLKAFIFDYFQVYKTLDKTFEEIFLKYK